MGSYADRLEDLCLMQELRDCSAGRDGVKSTDVEKLVGMVNAVADAVGPLLNQISQTFRQYTDHGIGHCRNVIDLMGRLIPADTRGKLNALELSVMLLAGLLHDSGMYVTDEEKEQTLASEGFREFRAGQRERSEALAEAESQGKDYLAVLISDSMLAEHFRRLHTERVGAFVRDRLGEGAFVLGDYDLREEVIEVAESHGWGVLETRDTSRPEAALRHLRTDKRYGPVPVNLQYAGCCLRLADILDFDRSRTPAAVFREMQFADPKSWREWCKHLQVEGWKIEERDIEYEIACQHPAYYVAVMGFVDEVDKELRDCSYLLTKEAPKKVGAHYVLDLPVAVDRRRVAMKDKRYVAGAFRFELDYERIMRLLMDKSLYPDPSLFLRELLQNSLDACRHREAVERAKGRKIAYRPRIVVWDYSHDAMNPRVVFQDNGMGMSQEIVERYFMRVGHSYYRSEEFDIERERLKVDIEACSQFGIGILSCFLVADRFMVETHRADHEPLRIQIEGPAKYFVIERLADAPAPGAAAKGAPGSDDDPPWAFGTRVTVFLREGVEMRALKTMQTFAVNVDYDLRVFLGGRKLPKLIRARAWEKPFARAEAVRMAASGGLDLPDPGREWTLPGGGRREAGFEEVLDCILAESNIPLPDCGSPVGLRGSAWLWLLRGQDGAPVPRRGYLAIGEKLRCVGAARFLGEVQEEIDPDRGDWSGLLRQLKASQPGQQSPLDDEDLIEAYLSVARKAESSPHNSDVLRLWPLLGTAQREKALQAVMNWAKAGGHPRSPWDAPWWRDPMAACDLLEGGTEWMSGRWGLGDPWQSVRLPQAAALHGILLPAGVVKWDPVAGKADRVALLSCPGGLQVDAQGSQAPTPAASRLFVDIEEGAKVGVAFSRAVLRHACFLAGPRPRTSSWEGWLLGLIECSRSLLFWAEAMCHEFELLEEALGYEIQGESQSVSRAELRSRFGRYVPIGGAGLSNWDDVTRWLVDARPRRKVGDQWEVDLDADPAPSPDGMRSSYAIWPED